MAAAVFLGTDTATQGNWVGKYGTDGYYIAGKFTSLPSYAVATFPGTFVWWDDATDPTALEYPDGSKRVESVSSAGNGVTSFGVPIATTGGTHRVAFYFLLPSANSPYPGQDVTQTVTVKDTATGTVLDGPRTMSGLDTTPLYFSWDVAGDVTFTITFVSGNQPGLNPGFSGVFFDPPPATPLVAPPSVVSRHGRHSSRATSPTVALPASAPSIAPPLAAPGRPARSSRATASRPSLAPAAPIAPAPPTPIAPIGWRRARATRSSAIAFVPRGAGKRVGPLLGAPVVFDGGDVLEAFQAWWNGIVPVATSDGRLWLQTAPEDVGLPYATCVLVSETVDTWTTAYPMVRSEIQVSLHAATAARARALGRALRPLARRAPLEINGAAVAHVLPMAHTVQLADGLGPGGRDCWAAIETFDVMWVGASLCSQ